jgi:hypothetical protein
MKRITSFVARSFVALLMVSGTLAGKLQAQTDLSMTVSVPFPFTVGTQAMEPGTYEFSLVSGDFLVSVLNVKTGEKKMFPSTPAEQLEGEQRGRLKFSDSNAHSVLCEIHFPGSDRFIAVDRRHGVSGIVTRKPPTGTSTFVAQR